MQVCVRMQVWTCVFTYTHIHEHMHIHLGAHILHTCHQHEYAGLVLVDLLELVAGKRKLKLLKLRV